MRTLLRGGRVVDPTSRLDDVMDVLIEGERIAALGARLEAAADRTIDLAGLVVLPGFMDLHVHLREPGGEAKETIRTGLRAAARGGFATVCAMPNTDPVNDRPEVTRFILAEADRTGLGGVYPIAAVTKGSRGEELVDMAALRAAGAVAFSDDGQPVWSSDIMRRALKEAERLGALLIDHCEDKSLSRGGVMNEGPVSRRLGLRGIPATAEEAMVERDIALAEELGARVHIAHLSTSRGVRLVAEAKARGVRVSAEATPHHLLLTEEALQVADPNFKMNPPLRSAADAEALVEGLRTGVIDAVATDHAPHTEREKARPFAEAPFGVVGLETAVPLMIDRFVRPGIIGLDRLAELLASNPARLLGLDRKGRIAPGSDADLTVIDLDRGSIVEKGSFESKGRNTPFQGWRLKGAVALTLAAGKIIFPFEASERFGRS